MNKEAATTLLHSPHPLILM